MTKPFIHLDHSPKTPRDNAWRLIVSINPSKPGYKPIRISVALDEAQGAIIQATPIGTINVAMEKTPVVIPGAKLADFKGD